MPDANENILSLYSGISEPKPWNTLLIDLVESTGSSGGSIMVSPPGEFEPIIITYVANGQSVTEFGQAYSEKLFLSDPFVNLPEGRVTTRHEYLGELNDEGTQFYDELQKTGTCYIAGFDVNTSSGLKGCLRVSRNIESHDYTEAEKAALAPLIPHFKEAITLYERIHGLRVEVRSHETALDKMTMAAFFVGHNGTVLKQNRMARALVDEKIGISVPNGVLTFSDTKTQRLFKDCLAQALSADRIQDDVVSMATVTDHDRNRTIHFALRSIIDPDVPISKRTPILAVYAKDPYGEMDIDYVTLSSLLGLTPTEAKLSINLSNHFDLNEVARIMNISHNTARSHLRSIYSKTHITRQSELIRMVLRAGAEFAVDTVSSTN